MRSVNGVPVDQEGVAKEGLQTVLRELQKGRAVVVFPEGGRCEHGRLEPLKAGILLLLKRVPATIVPMGVAGAFEAWPRPRPLPIPRRCSCRPPRARWLSRSASPSTAAATPNCRGPGRCKNWRRCYTAGYESPNACGAGKRRSVRKRAPRCAVPKRGSVAGISSLLVSVLSSLCRP